MPICSIYRAFFLHSQVYSVILSLFNMRSGGRFFKVGSITESWLYEPTPTTRKYALLADRHISASN